ncbi:hypothetical protein Ocin01_12778 [Orchesella cincta]|uniref:Uncharacterized protein n=1 Tax=Orchesella cincta TaxID=48709 RepID=A0A1D2MLN1_ORCCI|nr:hypothetical protein Ocin01_12778 [Orchesella cincta]
MISMLVGAACICALVIVTDGLPRNSRFKRETTSVDSSSSSSPAAETEGTTSSTQKPPVSTQNNDFGIGAAAGIGGLTRSVGIGNFQADPKSDAFAPWGAFAGLNLGNGGRIGAGCSGLSCGVQLGQLVLATPQLLGIGRNFFNQQQNNINRPDGKKLPEEQTAESNFNNAAANANANNPENIHSIFRDAFQGFRETLASFFRAPVTHFIKKNNEFKIDNSTESVVGIVKPAASEQKTFRIQLRPVTPPADEDENIIIDTRSAA